MQIKSQSIALFLLAAPLATLGGCGGGGGEDASSGSAPPEAPAPTATAYLLNIKGVRYKACGGHEGVTDTRGAFMYAQQNGCQVSFFIGSDKLALGKPVEIFYAGEANVVLTPYDLFPSSIEGDAAARRNLLTFLQSLNAKPNSHGLIEISEATDQIARDSSWTINFAADNFESLASGLLAQQPLADPGQAIRDYSPSVNCLHTGSFHGAFGGYIDSTDIFGNDFHSAVIDGGIYGIQTPDARLWAILTDRGSNRYALPAQYDHISGNVGPTPYGFGLETTTEIHGLGVHSRYTDAFTLYSDVTQDLHGWSGGFSTATPQRHANFADDPNWSRFYNAVAEMHFAGRTAETFLLGIDVYADNTVRAVVGDALSDTRETYGDRALLTGTLAGDVMEAKGKARDADPPRDFTLSGTIDRASMTFVGKVQIQKPSGSEPAPYMEFTADAPAAGCLVFPIE